MSYTHLSAKNPVSPARLKAMATQFERADKSDDYSWASELWQTIKRTLNEQDQETLRKFRLKIILNQITNTEPA